MRIASAALLALAAVVSAEKPLDIPKGDVKLNSEAGKRLLSKARKLGGDSDYADNMQYYKNVVSGNYYNQNRYTNRYGDEVDQEEQDAYQNGNGNGYNAYGNQYQQGGQNNRWYGNGDENDNDNAAYQNYGGEMNGMNGYGGMNGMNGYGSQVGSTNWLSDYSLKFDGCASDYDADGNGAYTRTELLARFKLCPNNSKRRCRHAGEYVVPMVDYVGAVQHAVVTDDNCSMQQQKCYSQCLEEARYTSAYSYNGDDDEGNRRLQGEKRRLQYWWQWNQKDDYNSRDQQDYEESEEYSQAKQQQYSNTDYSLYNGGNNAVANHNGQYDASSANTGQYGDYQSQYEAQMQQYQDYEDETKQYYSEGNYNNRGNWRRNNNGYGNDYGQQYWEENQGEDNDNGDNSYWGGYNGANGANNNGGGQDAYNNANGNGNYGRNADYNNYFDEDYCRADCMSNAGMGYCQENAQQNGNNGYNDINLSSLVECQPLSYWDAQSNPLYVGATCKNGGVYLDTFTDPICTKTAPKGTFEEVIGYNLPEDNLVSGDMFQCSATTTTIEYMNSGEFANYDEYQEYAQRQWENSVSMCDMLYRDAGRCEEHMRKEGKDTTGCDYIHRMGNSNKGKAWLRFGIGLVIAAGFLLAAYIGYTRSKQDGATLTVESVRASVSSMFQRGSKALKQPLAPTTTASDAPPTVVTGYEGAQIPAEAMTTEPIQPVEKEPNHDEEPTEVKKENNVV